MWWRGRKKNPETGPADSGLTGDPMLEGPPQDDGPKDLRSRWLNLKQSVTGTTAALPRVLRLVWDASPRTTLGLFAATVVAATEGAVVVSRAERSMDAFELVAAQLLEITP
jgi:ATP-binding cassette subfamily B protein